MNQLRRTFRPERVLELSQQDSLDSAQSNDFLLEMLAGLPVREAETAAQERPRDWSSALLSQMVDSVADELSDPAASASLDASSVSPSATGMSSASTGSVETAPASAATLDASLVSPSATGMSSASTGSVETAPASAATLDTSSVSPSATGMSSASTGSVEPAPASAATLDASSASPSATGMSSASTGSVEPAPAPAATPDARPEIKSVWTRSTTPMFDEAPNIYFNAADRYWEQLSWAYQITGDHTVSAVEPGPETWLAVHVNIPETGMIAGDQFTVTATATDPQGGSATESIDLQVDGIPMKTWEVFFDNRDAQSTGRVDRVGDRLREEARNESEPIVEEVEEVEEVEFEEETIEESDPLIFDLDMDGLLGTATGESLANGQLDGETVLFDIDPERSSWRFVSSTDVPGLDAPAIPNGSVVYENGDTESIGSNGRWNPQRTNGRWTHRKGSLYSAGNEFIGEWVATGGNQYDYSWGNRMDAEVTEWLQKGSGDGFLVWDHNGNGVIDDNTEMMSEYDVDGNFAFANGYEKLSHYFDKDEDGLIKGAELNGLLFWVDSNADAQTDTGELVPLSDHGITQIVIPAEGELSSEATIGRENEHHRSDEATFEDV